MSMEPNERDPCLLRQDKNLLQGIPSTLNGSRVSLDRQVGSGHHHVCVSGSITQAASDLPLIVGCVISDILYIDGEWSQETARLQGVIFFGVLSGCEGYLRVEEQWSWSCRFWAAQFV